MRKFLICCIFSLFTASVFADSVSASDLILNELTPGHLLVVRGDSVPQESFSVYEKKIQIKNSAALLSSSWLGWKIAPSERNVITFKARSLKEDKVQVKIWCRTNIYHATPADQCGGHAPDKTNSLIVTVGKNFQEVIFPFPVSEADLKCDQCGKILNFGSFHFNFEQESNGNIEITFPVIKTSFPIRINRSTDKQSSYLSNILSANYKPYEKKLPKHSMLSRDIREISLKANFMKRKLEEFRPVMELYKQKNYQQAVVLAEQISGENPFSQMMLYLVYSRAYDGIGTDYQKAARHFSKLLGSYYGREPGFMFYLHEYRNVWKKYRLVPTVPGEKVTVTSWGNNSAPMEEIIPLRGKYPLRECYAEKMRNIGGVIPRVLYMFARENLALRALRDEARKMGCAEAWAEEFAPFDSREFNPRRTPLKDEAVNMLEPEQMNCLQQASGLGYIPAKLIVARQLVHPGRITEKSIREARKLLQESIAECRKYTKTQCLHAATDREYAEDLLKIIPDENRKTADLLSEYRKIRNERDRETYYFQLRKKILENILSRRYDTPECMYFQALALPRNAQQKAMKNAAEKGSKYALLEYMYMIDRGAPDYWYFCYLAGKNGLIYQGNKLNYFNEAYQILKANRYMFSPDEYKKNIILLAPHHPEAKRELQTLSVSLDFQINCSENSSMSAKLINNGGRYMLHVTAEPSGDRRTVTFKKISSAPVRGEIFLYTTSQEFSNYDISLEFSGKNNKLQKMYPGACVPMEFIPQEMELILGPRKTPLDLQIRFLIRP